jgi:hypothetical protein
VDLRPSFETPRRGAAPRATTAKPLREDEASRRRASSVAARCDARQLAEICPAAMILIPCRDGASHVGHEWRRPTPPARPSEAQMLRDLVFAACPWRQDNSTDVFFRFSQPRHTSVCPGAPACALAHQRVPWHTNVMSK